MAKKHNKPPQTEILHGNEAAPTSCQPEAAPEAQSPSVTSRQVVTFWSVIVLMVAAAWFLDYIMPGTPEHTIERWLMLPFGCFLIFFLFRLK